MHDLGALDRDELLQRLREGEAALVADPGETSRLLHELQVHQIELELQNRELREAQVALEASRDRYADLYDFAPVGYLTLDSRGMILRANLQAASLLGRSREMLTRRAFAGFLDPAQTDVFLIHLRQVLKHARLGASPEAIDLTLPRSPRGRCEVLMECVAVAQGEEGIAGDGPHFLCTLIDITARRENERRTAADLDIMTRLQRVGTLFVRDGDLAPVLGEIVEAATAIADADFGNIQLIDPVTGDLRVVGQQGLPPRRVEYWEAAGEGQRVCRMALARRERVVVEDVECSPVFAGGPDLDLQRQAGVRAVQSTPLVSRSGVPIGVFSTYYRTVHRPDERALCLLDLLARQVADIIERKQAELDLQLREARMRAVIETASDGFWMIDPQGRLLDVNEAYVRRSGYAREELLAMSIGDLEASESSDQVRAHVAEVMRVGSDRFESLHRAKDGKVWPVEVSASYSQRAGGVFFAFLRDITKRKRLEQEIIEVGTAEQERIGRDIHDGIGQQLTGIAMLARSLERRLGAAGQVDAAAAAGQLRDHLNNVLQEVRAFSRGLAPVPVDAEGLAMALGDLADRVAESTGIDCRYRGIRAVRVAEDAMAAHLYRIAQEAVQNAVKHAQARHIQVGLERRRDQLVLTVRDDGKGIDPEPDRRGRLGLHIMAYRADLIGGRYSIRPVEGGGTEVRCGVPLRH